MAMRTRSVAVSLVVAGLFVAACGSTSSSEGPQQEGSTVAPSDQVSAGTIGSAPVTSSSDWDVRVTASGGGGLVDSVGTTDLEFLGGSGPDDPWLRFGLELNYCCDEPNTVVYEPDQWSLDVGEGRLRIDGPLCGGPVGCTQTERQVELAPHATTVVYFEVFRNVTGSAPVSEGTLAVDTAPLFDWDVDAIDDEPMAIGVRFDISRPVPPPTGDTTPTFTDLLPVSVVGGGLGVLDFPFLGVADDSDELADLVSSAAEPIDTAALDIDWPAEAVLVVSIGSNLCPPVLDGLQVDNGTATPVFVDAGYLMCEDPLVSYTVLAAIDRELLVDVEEIVVSADVSFADEDTVASIDVSPATAGRLIEPTDVTFGETNGTAILPPRGEATATVLGDGTPVYVVHHHDGTVSALDPRGAAQTIDGLHQIVTWVAATRTFLNRGAWDEYGRRLDGFRATDLVGYATRVVDDQVQIGGIVAAPAGSPITRSNDPPAMSNLTITPDDALTVDAATELPVGTTSWIAGSVHTRPDSAVVCDISPASTQGGPCPAGSPTAEGIPASPGSANTHFGPLLATRTDGGFDRIASTGGSAGTAL